MNNLNNNVGAISALRGYRKQFLYSLYRILSATQEENSFQPEGEFEDLDIYDENGQIKEIIQIKDLKDKLTLSDIVNSKQNAFIKRALKSNLDELYPIIKLVSYGQVNEDIQKLGNKKYDPKLKNKLKSFGLKDKDINILESYFCYDIVSEEDIIKEILHKIETLKIFSDLNISLDILVYWIYQIAEKQKSVDKETLKNQLLLIGKFESERINFYKHFNTLIRPLLKEELDANSKEKLKQDFYQGISATYNHIQANVDVIRKDKLDMIHHKFKESNIVFIHGASGQGKSSLAYRYLYDYCGNATVLTLNKIPNNIQTIYELIDSLEGISKGLNFPITIYIDVDPGQKEWINIIKELASKSNLNFLISIREEDWNAIEIQDLFRFEEIELYFDEDEASLIYESLNETQIDLQFLDFDDAWEAFGGKGPLLEFVYLITQKESLPAKLKAQINSIIDENSNYTIEKITLLRYISLADSYGAEINYKAISTYLGYPNIKRLIELLEKEYLLKITNNNSVVTGLHPVRSQIIKNILFDNEIDIESEYALEAIFFINDNSFLNFFRNIFKHTSLNPSDFIEKVKSIKLYSWQSYYSIFKTLQWKGINDYINDNISVLDQVYEEYGESWFLVINFDLCNVLKSDESLMENSELFSQDQRQFAKSINQQISDKKNIFNYAIDWLKSIKEISLSPQNEIDWDSFALFVFWINYLELKNISISNSNLDVASISSTDLSLLTLSHLMFALACPYFNSKDLLAILEPIFRQKLHHQYNILSLDKNNDEIVCLYFWDIIDEELDTNEKDFIHAKSIKIIDLVRFAYPNYKTYITKGLGHKISIIDDDYDSSEKAISTENLPLAPLVETNSTFVNLYRNRKRPDSWKEYADKIIKVRQKFVTALFKQHTALVLYHKKKNYSSLLSYIQEYGNSLGPELYSIVMKRSLLPQTVIDEWGGISENQKKKNNITDSFLNKRSISIEKYSEYLNYFQEYYNSLDNYLRQSANTILRVIKQRLNEDVSELKDYSRVSLVANLYEAYINLNDFQKSFRIHFEKFIDIRFLSKIESDEIKFISELCFLYNHFIYSSSLLNGNVSNIATTKLKQSRFSLNKKIENELSKLGKNENIKFKIYDKEIPHSCIIIADFNSAIDSLGKLSLIYDVLFDAIGEPEATSIKSLIISKYFSTINIIPMVKGKSQDLKWYEFKAYNLIDKRIEELATFNLIPHDIPANIISSLNIENWSSDIPDIHFLKELLACINTMHSLAFSFQQYKNLGEVEDDFGVDIFLEYILKTNNVMQENFQKAIDLYSEQLNRCNNNYYQYKDSFEEQDALQLMLDTYPLFYPNDDDSKDDNVKLVLSPENVEEWISRLDKLKENIALLYYFYTDKMIERYLKK